MDLYEEEYAPDRPVVCFDETSRQLVRDSRPGIGAPPGRVERYDYEYERNGTRNLFVFCEPKAGYRHVEVTKRRTGVDFAEQPAYVLTCRPGDELNIFFIPREVSRPLATVRYLDISPELLCENEGMSEAFSNFTAEQMRKGPRDRLTVLRWTE